MIRNFIAFFLLFISFSSLWGHDGIEYRFIENKNQWDKKILFRSDIPSGALFLEKNCFTFHLTDPEIFKHLHGKRSRINPDTVRMRGHAYKLRFVNSNEDVITESYGESTDYYNYFKGKDKSKWAGNVKSYNEVYYRNLYSGIDLRVFTSEQQLKYEFEVLAGVDPSLVKVQYEGVDQMYLRGGNLIVKTSVGNVIEKKPYSYQIIKGKRVTVPCKFVIQGNLLTYHFPSGYDRSYKLIIDPTLMFSTYSGSFSNNFGYTATFDSEGFLYSGSTAFGTLYPTTVGAYDRTFEGFNTDIAITKYDTSGTKRIYSTYIGGVEDELPHSLFVNNNDELFLFGTTSSMDYPTTKGAFDESFNGGFYFEASGLGVEYINGSDIIVSRFNIDGTMLIASTYVGGSSNDGVNLSYFNLNYNYADEARGEIDIDKDDNIYISTCTYSADFPVTATAFQTAKGGGLDACVFRMDNNLSTMVWSSFLGGTNDDATYSIAIDSLGDLYVAGGTSSADFPVTAGVVGSTYNGNRDGFVSHISKNGDTVLQSTFYGSPQYDQIYFVELDRNSVVYVFGQTEHVGADFIFNAAFNQPGSGQFITKFNGSLSGRVWSTVFGRGLGTGPDISPTAFMVDLCNKVYLAGWGGVEVNDFGGTDGLITKNTPEPQSFIQTVTDDNDFYLFVLEDDASSVHYASFFGGLSSPDHVDGGTSRFDRKGKIYHAVCASCWGVLNDYPTKPNPGAVSTTNNSICNSAVFKMDFNLPIVVADFDFEPGCFGVAVQFENKSLEQSLTTFQWSFGDGGTSTAKNPTHTYSNGGTYDVTLIIADNATCNLADTITKSIYVSNFPGNVSYVATTDKDTIYRGQSTTLHAIPNTGGSFVWSPAGSLSSATSPDPVASPDTTTIYTLTIFDPLAPACRVDTTVKVVVIELNCDEPHIYVPNAFTPNSDGKNELLYVRSKVIKEFYFTIYNRWGEKVFETSDMNVGWDGTYKGMKADPGVFVYYLEGLCLDDQKFFIKGNVTLIR